MATDASAAVTSEQASTFEISDAVVDGVGEWLTDEAVDELDDPHPLTRRPTVATRAIAPLTPTVLGTADRIGAAPVRLNLGPVASQGNGGLSSGSNGIASRR